MINTKRTKIVCTIGPATKDVEILKKMTTSSYTFRYTRT